MRILCQLAKKSSSTLTDTLAETQSIGSRPGSADECHTLHSCQHTIMSRDYQWLK